MKIGEFPAATAVLLGLVIGGCGPGVESAPQGAVMHPRGNPPAAPRREHWTKADKIAVVQKSPIPDAQKQAEIAKINSEPGD